MEQNNLYDKEIWDSGYKNYDFFTAGDRDPVKQYILANIPPVLGTCFEVGCFPGRYLSVLGQKNWILNGVDQTEYLPSMEKWLKSLNYPTANFINSEFERIDSSTQYDLVYSCGFIEHFTNWEEIFVDHLKLVNLGGRIIITTPNFTGLQGVLHRFLDNENYFRHNVKSMNPSKWKRLLEQNGFTVLDKSYFGKFNFWYGSQPRPYYKRFCLFRFMKLIPFLQKIIFFDSKQLSPFCGVVGVKNKG
jgi:2-polyprenyl-3-methyl-5-hydroxy-6-metoxy-1,4-benzoquinol methylase